MRRRHFAKTLIFLLALLFAAAPAHAQNGTGSDTRRVDPFAGLAGSARAMESGAVDKLAAGNCGAGWGLTWRLFRNGQSLAAAGLAYAVYYKGLVPPAATADRISQARHFYILAAYAAPSEAPQALALIRKAQTLSDIDGGDFLACLEDPVRSGEACLDTAIAAGLLPRVEDYAREVEGFTRTGARRARCNATLALWPGARAAANPHAATVGD